MTGPNEGPAYERAANTLREAIEQGVYPPGSRLPRYADLSQRFGIAKQTVAEAIDVLTREGLVKPRRGRLGGTFVVDRTVVRFPFSVYSLVGRTGSPHGGPWQTACAREGVEGDMVVLAAVNEPAPPDIAEILQRGPGSYIVRRRRHATLNGRPVQIQDAIYPYDLAEGNALGRPGRVEGGVLPLLNSLPGIEQPIRIASLEMAVRNPTRDEAEILDLRGEPVADVQRLIVDASGRPVELLRIVATRVVHFVVDAPPDVTHS